MLLRRSPLRRRPLSRRPLELRGRSSRDSKVRVFFIKCSYTQRL
jgi:hypothetical protein